MRCTMFSCIFFLRNQGQSGGVEGQGEDKLIAFPFNLEQRDENVSQRQRKNDYSFGPK